MEGENGLRERIELEAHSPPSAPNGSTLRPALDRTRYSYLNQNIRKTLLLVLISLLLRETRLSKDSRPSNHRTSPRSFTFSSPPVPSSSSSPTIQQGTEPRTYLSIGCLLVDGEPRSCCSILSSLARSSNLSPCVRLDTTGELEGWDEVDGHDGGWIY